MEYPPGRACVACFGRRGSPDHRQESSERSEWIDPPQRSGDRRDRRNPASTLTTAERCAEVPVLGWSQICAFLSEIWCSALARGVPVRGVGFWNLWFGYIARRGGVVGAERTVMAVSKPINNGRPITRRTRAFQGTYIRE